MGPLPLVVYDGGIDRGLCRLPSTSGQTYPAYAEVDSSSNDPQFRASTTAQTISAHGQHGRPLAIRRSEILGHCARRWKGPLRWVVFGQDARHCIARAV